MSNPIKGDPRPKSTKTQDALEKRVRRALAEKFLCLRKTRAGSLERAEYGTWVVMAPKSRDVLKVRTTLEEIAKELGISGGEA